MKIKTILAISGYGLLMACVGFFVWNALYDPSLGTLNHPTPGTHQIRYVFAAIFSLIGAAGAQMLMVGVVLLVAHAFLSALDAIPRAFNRKNPVQVDSRRENLDGETSVPPETLQVTISDREGSTEFAIAPNAAAARKLFLATGFFAAFVGMFLYEMLHKVFPPIGLLLISSFAMLFTLRMFLRVSLTHYSIVLTSSGDIRFSAPVLGKGTTRTVAASQIASLFLDTGSIKVEAATYKILLGTRAGETFTLASTIRSREEACLVIDKMQKRLGLPPDTEVKATASSPYPGAFLVLLMGVCSVIVLFTGPLALWIGYRSLGQLPKTEENYTERKMANIGIALGYFSTILLVIFGLLRDSHLSDSHPAIRAVRDFLGRWV